MRKIVGMMIMGLFLLWTIVKGDEMWPVLVDYSGEPQEKDTFVWPVLVNYEKQQNPETVKAKSNLGIKMNSDCLVHGGCSLDVYKTLWMRADSGNEDRTSVLSFFQDIIGAATFFIGTIVTIAFVWSGFQCILAGRNGDSSGRAKALKGMLYSIVGLIIVMSSYAIIRLVQYLAATGG